MATLAEDGALDYAAYEAPRRLLVSARNGALVRAGADPVEGSAVVAELARFDACVAVGEAVVGGGKVRVRLAAPVAGWASGRCFVEVRDAVGRDDWAATAERAARAAPGRVEILARDPLAFTIAGFASDAEVARVVAEASPRLGAALVAGDAAGEAAGSSRSARVAWLPRAPDAWLAARVAAILDLPVSHAESLQVVKYEAGGEYRPHFDAFPLESARGRRAAVRGGSYAGQRRVTALLYLNDVAAGGGTAFHCDTPDEFVVAPARGKLLVFYNCFEDGADRHPMSLHAGLPVGAGDKWIANLWWRANPYQPASPAALASAGRDQDETAGGAGRPRTLVV